MNSSSKYFHFHTIFLVFILSFSFPFKSFANVNATAGQIVSSFGDVWVSSSPENPWREVSRSEKLYIGYTVKTGRLSGASLRMEDESLIRLSQNSEFKVEGVRVSSFWRRATSLVSGINQGLKSTYRLLTGKLWGRNNNRRLNSKIITATATIGIRGTEYSVEANEQFSRVSIHEGVVQAENDQGDVVIRSGESAMIEQGKAPQKSTIVQVGESVQWTVAVPGLIDMSLFLKRAIENKLVVAEVFHAVQQSQYAVALDLIAKERTNNPSDPDLQIVESWINLKAGEIAKVYAQLKSLSVQYPDNVSVKEFTAFSALLNGQLDTAKSMLAGLIQQQKISDIGWIVNGYVNQAEYDLPAAEKSYNRALELNPKNKIAVVQLATLYFGSEQTDRTLNLVNKLLIDDAGNQAAANLKGFILLSKNETSEALAIWQQSQINEKADAQTYFGLSLAYMRKGRVEEAMQSIATAVLLDPQRSMYLSYWGKMLYQIGRFDKALTVLDSAIRLDKQDPTPRLYKAIILRDLNRPGDAIRHIQTAIKLNDNRGVYRSRSLLDQDLAVQNVDLSRLFTQLGLSDWAHKKAMDSIKADFTNASAHILNAGAFIEMEDRAYALNNEALLARILQHANINAFSSFNGYTSLYEAPDTEFDLQLGAGNHGQMLGSLISAGAIPDKQMAWAIAALHDDSDGWRDTNGETVDNLSFIGKWQPSRKNNLMFTVSATEFERLDDFSTRYEVDAPVDDLAEFSLSTLQLELGLHHKLSSTHDLLAYAALVDASGDLIDNNIDQVIQVGLDELTQERLTKSDFERPYSLLQLQGLWKIQNHQLFYGLLTYRGQLESDTDSDYGLFDPAHTIIDELLTFDEQLSINPDINSTSLYLQDSWQLMPSLQIDAAVYVEELDNADALTGAEWTVTETTTRLGVVWQANTRNTFRVASFDYLLPFIASRLDPTDIAGIPIYKNTREGSLVSETDLVWDFEWENGLISTSVFKVEESFTSAAQVGTDMLESTVKSENKGFSITLNTMLGLRTGLNAAFSNLDISSESSADTDREESSISLSISHVYESGLHIRAKQITRDLQFDSARVDETINVTNLSVSYEFANKSQSVELAVINLFDEEFNWVTDNFSTTGIAPARMIAAKYRVSF